MVVLEYLLLVALLVAAVFIVVAVIFQKSGEDGLSGAISGGAETFYGRDKSAHGEKKLYKWTLIASLVFAVAVVVVYIIQPDYAQSYSLTDWQDLNGYSFIFK